MGEDKKSSRKSSDKEKKSKEKEKKEEKKSDRKSDRKSDKKSSSKELDRHSSHSSRSGHKSSSSKHEKNSKSSSHHHRSSSHSHHKSSSSRHGDDGSKEREEMDESKDSIDSFENYYVPPIQFKELPDQETDSDKSDGEIAEYRPLPKASPAVLKLKEEASKMDAYLDDLDSELNASVNELTDTNKAFAKKSRRISCLEGVVYRDELGAIAEGISDSEDEEKVHPVHGAKEFDWEKYGKQKAASL